METFVARIKPRLEGAEHTYCMIVFEPLESSGHRCSMQELTPNPAAIHHPDFFEGELEELALRPRHQRLEDFAVIAMRAKYGHNVDIRLERTVEAFFQEDDEDLALD